MPILIQHSPTLFAKNDVSMLSVKNKTEFADAEEAVENKD